MSLKQRKRNVLPSLSLQEDDNINKNNNINKNLRETERWKNLYERNIDSLSAMRGPKKEENYKKMIDRLASAKPINQKNILSGFKPFASPTFKYKSDE